LDRVLQVLFSCIGFFFVPSNTFAAVADSQFVISADGASVDFDVREVARSYVVDRLLANRDIKIEWLNREIADEVISGQFQGTISGVARGLLAQFNVVLGYSKVNDEVRITRIIVVGRVAAGRTSPGMAALEPARKPTQKLPVWKGDAQPPLKIITAAETSLVPTPAGTISTPLPGTVAGPPPPVMKLAPSNMMLPGTAPIPNASTPALPGTAPTNVKK
jgi:hypothetical protein